MKIGVTAADGKTYILSNEYESIASVMYHIRSVYSSASLIGVNHFAYLICEDGICVFTDKIVSVFEVKNR